MRWSFCFVFPLETVEISECCVKRELCHLFSTNLRMLLRGCSAVSILGQGTKNLHEHRFTGKPSHSAAAVLKNPPFLEDYTQKKPQTKWHLLAWPAPRRAAAACPGEAASHFQSSPRNLEAASAR